MIDLYTPSKPEKHRTKKIAENMRMLLSEVFIRSDLPAFTIIENGKRISWQPKNPITVTQVNVSPDLKNATVFFMPLGGFEKEKTLAYLRLASGYIRSLLSKQMTSRTLPSLSFFLDPIFASAERIDNCLLKAKIQAKPVSE